MKSAETRMNHYENQTDGITTRYDKSLVYAKSTKIKDSQKDTFTFKKNGSRRKEQPFDWVYIRTSIVMDFFNQMDDNLFLGIQTNVVTVRFSSRTIMMRYHQPSAS